MTSTATLIRQDGPSADGDGPGRPPFAGEGPDVPLPWVRLDSAFPWNQKLLAMIGEKDGYRAGLVYVCALAYSGAQGTDGFISREALPHIHGRLSDAQRLARHEFWEEQPGGWLIHGWAEFQPSTAETQERSRRAQAAANARWDGHEPQTGAERARRSRSRRKERNDAPPGG